jgi:hypothetical protein
MIKKCKVCKKVIRSSNKKSICSNCQNRRVGELIKRGLLKL